MAAQEDVFSRTAAEGYHVVDICGQPRVSPFGQRRHVPTRVQRAILLRDDLLPEAAAAAVQRDLQPFVLILPPPWAHAAPTQHTSLHAVSADTVTEGC